MRASTLGFQILALIAVLLLFSFFEPFRKRFSEHVRPPHRDPSSWLTSFVVTKSPYTTKRYFLSVYAIFRNEETLVNEWFDHYRRRGVDHFFLVDHGPSTDKTLFMLRKEIQAGFVTVFTYTDRSNGAQVRAYRKFFPNVRAETEWMLMADLDEFLISRNPHTQFTSFPDIIRNHFAGVSFILVPDTYFGSSGHKTQPPTVLCNFLKRANYDVVDGPDWLNPTLTRYMVRTDDAMGEDINVNNCYTKAGAVRRLSLATNTSFVPPPNIDRLRLTEADVATAYFSNNHYRILSMEWYMKVRATRGNVYVGNSSDQAHWTTDCWRNERAMFDAFYNAVKDPLLASQTPYCPQHKMLP